MKLSLPKSVRIGPYDYRIIHRKIPVEDECLGDFAAAKATIRITTGLPRRQTVEALVHEIFHAIWYSWSLEDEDHEERIVSVMSTGLASVVRDNPWFLGLMRELEDGK